MKSTRIDMFDGRRIKTPFELEVTRNKYLVLTLAKSTDFGVVENSQELQNRYVIQEFTTPRIEGGSWTWS